MTLNQALLNKSLLDATKCGNAEAMRIRIRQGASVDARGYLFNTPLHIAAKLGDLEAVRLLLDRGADTTNRNFLGHTALNVAQKDGHFVIAKMISNLLNKNEVGYIDDLDQPAPHSFK